VNNADKTRWMDVFTEHLREGRAQAHGNLGTEDVERATLAADDAVSRGVGCQNCERHLKQVQALQGVVDGSAYELARVAVRDRTKALATLENERAEHAHTKQVLDRLRNERGMAEVIEARARTLATEALSEAFDNIEWKKEGS